MAGCLLRGAFLLVATVASPVPSGLLCNGRRAPAIGITDSRPDLTWVLPHLQACGHDQQQVAHQLEIMRAPRGADMDSELSTFWQTQRQNSSRAQLNAPVLLPATRYHWRVRVWMAGAVSGECASGWSPWAEVMTAPLQGFATGTHAIWFPSPDARYTLHRAVLPAPASPYTAATAFVTAATEKTERLLGAYRLLINGVAVGVGPGRGDGATGRDNPIPYDAIDVPPRLLSTGAMAIGLQCYSPGGSASGAVLLELHLEHADGSTSVLATGGPSWRSFDATAAYGPDDRLPEGGYKAPNENIDAELMPVSWATPTFTEDPATWLMPQVQAGKLAATYPKRALPLNVTEGRVPVRWLEAAPGRWFADFGSELMGGLRLEVPAGALPPHTRVQVTLSEELIGDVANSTRLLYPMRTGNHYRSVWRTRSAGPSVLEHHEYMVFRYAELLLLDAVDVPRRNTFRDILWDLFRGQSGEMVLTAWQVQYSYFEKESSFASSNETLNRVWRLCEQTMRATSLDTATDSNTRERLPYEADGFITAQSWLALQREFQWPQHSWRYTAWNPTWPTEWRQTAALFAEADYLATGSLELVDTFAEAMLKQTQQPCVSSALDGLVDFAEGCKRQTGGMGTGAEAVLRDIVDWPMVSRDGYKMTGVNTVVNAYAVGGLQALARLGAAGGGSKAGLPARVESLWAQANATAATLNTMCSDGATGLYWDGLSDATGRAPLQHSSWHAQVFPAAFGLAPEERWPQLLEFLRTRGMTGSVYGAFWALKAAYNMDSDHGHLALELMASCGTNSWCNMINQGATAVMEAWTREEKPNLSWSHPWASAPASAVAWGLFGIEATSPAFRTFSFKPQPGSLAFASIEVPTMSGTIAASLTQNATSFTATLAPPPGTSATACLPRLDPSLPATLKVDGVDLQGHFVRDYVCVQGLGSSTAPRLLSRTRDVTFAI